MKRRRYTYPGRDPAEKRKRPYQRYASRVLNKRALRSMALQSIGRPEIAQGPLHDALLEFYPEEYGAAIMGVHRQVGYYNQPYAILFNPNPREPVEYNVGSRFRQMLWTSRLEQRMNEQGRLPTPGQFDRRSNTYRSRLHQNYIVTYIAYPRDWGTTSGPRSGVKRGVSHRDPPEKKKRPYRRYAAKKMSKLALRRLALQSIGRPGVAQGPLHDTLLQMYPEEYNYWIAIAEDAADHGFQTAVILEIKNWTFFRLDVKPSESPAHLEDFLNRHRMEGKSYVIPYVTRPRRRQ